MRAHEHDQAEEEPREESADVREVVDVGQDAEHQVDGGDEQERRHGHRLVGVDGPVGDELGEHGAQQAEERA